MRRDVLESLDREDADAWDVCRGLVRVAGLLRHEWALSLSAVLELLLSRLEAARLLQDDRPELVAAVLRRWAENSASIEDLQQARELLREARYERNTNWFSRDWKSARGVGLLATSRVMDAVEAAVDFVLTSPLDDCRNLEAALWSASNALATIEDPDAVTRSADISKFPPEAWAQVRSTLLGAIPNGPAEPDSALALASAMRAAR